VLVVVLVATGTVIAVAGMTVGMLYQAAFEEERQRLVDLARGQARLMEAVARFDAGHSGAPDPQAPPFSATLSQLADAHERYRGIGTTGEFTLARRQADRIVFLLSRRRHDRDGPQPVTWDGSLAEPTRRALKGQSGSLVGPDYRGVTVLAAHEPVALLNLGMVAKIDMAEIRKPFIRAAAVSGLGILVLVTLAGLLVRALAAPILMRSRTDDDSGAAWADLQQRFEARTAELHEIREKLLRKERLAAMGQLTGTVAHELRNPLGAIMSSVAVLRIKTADTGLDLERSLSRIDRSVGRCDRIVTELLDFARARGLQPELTGLDRWLGTLLEDVRIPPDIALRRRLNLPGIEVKIDREAFRRAVVNVVDNAYQAMTDDNSAAGHSPGRFLTLATRRKDGRIEIEITDTGPGIPEDVLPRVLEPLYSTRTSGTGLGLPTVQQIMEDHGGGLEVSSVLGLGTRVILWLPLSGGGATNSPE